MFSKSVNERGLIALLNSTTHGTDAEILKAIKEANRMLMEGIRTWDSVICLNQQAYKPPRPRTADSYIGSSWPRLVAACSRPGYVTDWELQFLESLRAYNCPSEKQRAVLYKIAARLGVEP